MGVYDRILPYSPLAPLVSFSFSASLPPFLPSLPLALPPSPLRSPITRSLARPSLARPSFARPSLARPSCIWRTPPPAPPPPPPSTGREAPRGSQARHARDCKPAPKVQPCRSRAPRGGTVGIPGPAVRKAGCTNPATVSARTCRRQVPLMTMTMITTMNTKGSWFVIHGSWSWSLA